MKVDEGNTQPRTVEKIRHLTLLFTADNVEFPTSMLNQGNLHSLIMVRLHWSANALMLPHQTSRSLRYLRTLNMSKCGISWLPGQLIGQLRHLRYLNLSCNINLIELPDEVCDLCNLQTLTLLHCHCLKRLPEGMGKLVNLRHLRTSGCDYLKGLPKGIGRLTQLRTLDTLVIPENNHEEEEEEYLSIGDLEKAKNHLQFESASQIMGCENLKSPSEVEKVAGLVTRGGNVAELHLEFHLIYQVDEQVSKKDDEFMILEALQPHPRLKSLVINGYRGTNLSPKWMTSLDYLTRLEFWSCQFFETFPPLGSLPCLEELDVTHNSELRKIGGEFMGITTTTSSSTSSRICSDDDDNNVANGAGGVHQFISFPKLKQLRLSMMSRWEEWEGCESTTTMPCLSFLYISQCNALRSLPLFLKDTPLKHLRIDHCKIPSQSFRRSGKERAQISDFPNIQIDYKNVKMDGIWMEDAFSYGAHAA